MNKKEAWNVFKKTGRVEDYLVYAEKKGSKDDYQSGRDDCE